jgi:hypothetical protein
VIVVDTNVVWELMRPEPARVVLAWLRRQVAVDLFTTAVTSAEVHYGIAWLPDCHPKDVLSQAADQVFGALPDQIRHSTPMLHGPTRTSPRAVNAMASRLTASMPRSPQSAECAAHGSAPGTSGASAEPVSTWSTVAGDSERLTRLVAVSGAWERRPPRGGVGGQHSGGLAGPRYPSTAKGRLVA